MAIKTVVTRVDDMDGSPAVATYVFSWQGTKYQIDLSKAHGEEMKADMAKWVSVARRVRTGGRVAGSRNMPKAEPVAATAAKPAAKAAAKTAAKPAAKAATKAAAKPAAKKAAKPAGRRAAAKKPTGPDPAAVRAWAISQGIKVADRGRLAPGLIEQFVKAHAATVDEQVTEARAEIAELATTVEVPQFSTPTWDVPRID